MALFHVRFNKCFPKETSIGIFIYPNEKGGVPFRTAMGLAFFILQRRSFLRG